MMEICKFKPHEIDEAIEGMDGLRNRIAPILENINYEGMGKQDVEQLTRHLTLAKHALITMGDFLEKQMSSPVCGAKEKGDIVSEKMAVFCPGDDIWVIERDRASRPYEVTGYMFLAEVCDYIIASSFINDLTDAGETLESLADDTWKDYCSTVCVFPTQDVFKEKSLAKAKVQHELDALAGGKEA